MYHFAHYVVKGKARFLELLHLPEEAVLYQTQEWTNIKTTVDTQLLLGNNLFMHLMISVVNFFLYFIIIIIIFLPPPTVAQLAQIANKLVLCLVHKLYRNAMYLLKALYLTCMKIFTKFMSL